MQAIVPYLAEQPGRVATVRELRRNSGLTEAAARQLLASGNVFALHHDLPAVADPASVLFLGSECITALCLRESATMAKKVQRKAAEPGTLADLIRATIKRRELSGYAVAKLSGVNVAAVNRFLSGERSLTLESADKIMRALGLEVREKEPL